MLIVRNFFLILSTILGVAACSSTPDIPQPSPNDIGVHNLTESEFLYYLYDSYDPQINADILANKQLISKSGKLVTYENIFDTFLEEYGLLSAAKFYSNSFVSSCDDVNWTPNRLFMEYEAYPYIHQKYNELSWPYRKTITTSKFAVSASKSVMINKPKHRFGPATGTGFWRFSKELCSNTRLIQNYNEIGKRIYSNSLSGDNTYCGMMYFNPRPAQLKQFYLLTGSSEKGEWDEITNLPMVYYNACSTDPDIVEYRANRLESQAQNKESQKQVELKKRNELLAKEALLLNWKSSVNSSNKLVGEKVCTFDNKFGYIESISADKIKFLMIGNLSDKPDGFFFNQEDKDFNYKKLEEYHWLSTNELGVCSFK